MKSDLGGKNWSLCLASSCWCQTALCCGFHYFTEFRSKEGKGSSQKGTCSVFTVTVINLDDLKNYLKYPRDGSWPHGGSTTPHMRPNHQPALCDRSWQTWFNGVDTENNLFTNVPSGSQRDNICSKAFASISQVCCQQSFSCVFFSDVVSERSEYWQTPGLSGMDTIYGPARVTASDLVKKWRILMQRGIKSRGTRMSVFINLHDRCESMSKSWFLAQNWPKRIQNGSSAWKRRRTRSPRSFAAWDKLQKVTST